MGEQSLKNIARPVRAFRLRSGRDAAHVKAALPALPDKPSPAVLPFQNMGGDAEQDYFADGVVKDIIAALSRFRSFAVVARNSSFVYKVRAVDIRQVATELDVGYVLEGSIRRSGDRLRITAQLIEATSGTHLWADRFDGSVGDVFDVQDYITESVATIVWPQIRDAEIARSRQERPDSIASYDLYLRALPKHRSGIQEESKAAYVLLTKAIELEPTNAVVLAQAVETVTRHDRWPATFRLMTRHGRQKFGLRKTSHPMAAIGVRGSLSPISKSLPRAPQTGYRSPIRDWIAAMSWNSLLDHTFIAFPHWRQGQSG